MGLLNAVDQFSRNKARTKSDSSGQMMPEKGAAGGSGGHGVEDNPDDTSTLDKEEGNVLTTIIAQCEFTGALGCTFCLLPHFHSLLYLSLPHLCYDLEHDFLINRL